MTPDTINPDTINPDTARDDLAFLRSLVKPDGRWQQKFGEGYFAAGLCYGVQMLLHGAQRLGWAPEAGPVALAIGLGPTVVFLAILTWLIRRDGSAIAGGATSRALGSVFAGVGFSNVVLIVIIGSISWRLASPTVWLIYPCVVMVLQGLAWFVAFSLQRRAWYGVVAVGWLALSIIMALSVFDLSVFIFVTGLGFLTLMLVPGWVMMRGPKA